MTAETGFSFVWTGGAGEEVVGIEHTYTGPKNSFRCIGASVDGMILAGLGLPRTSRVDN